MISGNIRYSKKMMHDRFRKGAPKGKGNAEYYQTVDQIEDKIKARWPKNYGSIAPFIERLESDRSFCFSLLNGQVQAGKFLTANILMWILTIKHHLHVAYITKNLDIVRKDAINKLERGAITDLIVEHSGSLGLSEIERRSFLLKTISGLELDKLYDTRTKAGKSVGDCAPGERVVPIFIMQGDNYRSLFRHIKAVNENVASHCVVIVDEVHELYTEGGWSDEIGSLVPVEKDKKITARHALHKLYDMCKQNNSATLLGITATPERVLVKDPLCCVNRIYNLVPDPPFEGAVYYGYHDTEAKLLNVQVMVRQDSYIGTIDRILEREPNQLHSGPTEVKFIYISSEDFAQEQDQLYRELVEAYGDRIYCKMLIGVTTAKSNGIDEDHMVLNLEEFFNSNNLTQKICKEGAIILISNKMLAASATVKPPLGGVCELKIDDDDSGLGDVDAVTYRVVGITDQIVSKASHIEAHKQKMRGHGWYLSGHVSYCWVPEDYVNDTEYGVQMTHLDILKQYDIEVGPPSIREITSSMSCVEDICPGCPYRSSKRFGIVSEIVAERPEEGVELETSFYRPIYTDRWQDMKLEDLLYNTETKEDRDELKKLLNPTGESKHQMPWPQVGKIDARYSEIIHATVQPTMTNSQWKVNSFAMSDGDLFKDPISSLYTVKFKDEYHARPHWASDECRDTCDEHLHVSLQTPIWFKISDGYMFFRMGKVMTHLFADSYVDWQRTPDYDAILAQIDRRIELAKQKRIRFYEFFGKLCKVHLADSRGRLKYGAWLSGHYKEIADDLKEAGQEIAINTDLDDDEKLEQVHSLLKPYFAMVNGPPPKKIKVRVKPGALADIN